ncbi:Fe-S cluster assembly iron-binding protein IscA [Clostridium pascui]|nr:Fe-S cluster assembly iron-binding protein IscA [Clostridium pascui]
MIKVTEMAAEKIKQNISKQKNPEKVMLRISFGGYG